MLLQFAAGVLVARAAQNRRLPDAVAGGLLLGAGVAILALMQAFDFVNELWRPFLWGVPALLIVLGAVTLETRVGVLPSRALKALGDASYAIYLVHLPVTAVVAHTLGHDNPWTLAPVAVVASAAAGLAWRAWLEKPLIDILRGLGRHRPALSAA